MSKNMMSLLPSLAMVLAGLPSVSDEKRSNADFGEDSFGYEFGADGSLLNSPNNMARALAEKQETAHREHILNPNRGSTAKIQRYVFGLSQLLTLATPADINMTGKPRTQFRPQRITSNVPFKGFGYVDDMQVANVGILVGGTVDLSDFSPDGGDQCLDVPTLGPQNEVSLFGSSGSGSGYTGLTNDVAPFHAGSFELTVSFKGPATMAGG